MFDANKKDLNLILPSTCRWFIILHLTLEIGIAAISNHMAFLKFVGKKWRSFSLNICFAARIQHAITLRRLCAWLKEDKE